MYYRKLYFIAFVLLLFTSCLYSRTTGPSSIIDANLRITYGSAIVEIYGEVTDNLYNQRMSPIENDKYQNLVIREGTVTRHETIYLSAGNEYSFSLLPAESVSITVMPSTDKVELTTYQQGKEKKYSVDRANKLGLSLIFQHR